MMKKKYSIYLYPKVFPSENPYISDLEESISPFFKVANRRPNKYGVINLFQYIFNADVYYFNWIENLPLRKYGGMQVLLFLIFLFLLRLFGKKIIWTLHNKQSHEQEKRFLTDRLFNLMFKNAHLIITHSMEGVRFAKKEYPLYAEKVKYIIHPAKNNLRLSIKRKKIYDLFIWGTIWPYKGVVEFIQFITNLKKDVKVLVIGKCFDEQYKKRLLKFISDNVIYMDEFLEIDKIAYYTSLSRYTLFTYKPDSVLSSGSLMDSIGLGASVIGPDIGAFNDLSMYGFVRTYSVFDDILRIIDKKENNYENVNTEIERFCSENSWEIFGEKICGMIDSLVL